MNPRRSLLLDVLVETIVRIAFIFSLYLLFAGHNAPGGGFVGGLTAGAAVLLLYAAQGLDGLDASVRVRAAPVLGLGVLLAVGTGIGGYLWGDGFLGSAKVEEAVPLLGTMKFTTALPFDIGVYLVVVGIALAGLRSLGHDDDVDGDGIVDARRPEEVTS